MSKLIKKIYKALRIFNKPIESNLIFFIFLFITGAFCIIFEPGFGHRIQALFNLFFDLYILCAIIALLPEKLGKGIRFILYVTLYGVTLLDVVLYERIDSPITPVFIQLVEQTNRQEATEAIFSYITPSLLFSRVGAILLIIIANIIAAKYIRNSRLPEPKHSTLTGGIILCLFVSCGLISKTDIEYKYYRVICQYDELKTQQIKDLTPKSLYYVPIYRLIYSISENNRLKYTIRGLAASVNKASVDSCSHISPNIVLIIGESVNKHHCSLYGYALPTNPYQVEREHKGELFKFDNVISSWNVTCESFENMLSVWSEGDKGEWYNSPLFPEIFRKAHYYVTFVSNQFVQNPSTSFSDFKEDIFINNEKISNANFDARNNRLHQYDEGLIDDSKRLGRGKYNLNIFHFKGVHADFKDRFPKQFAFFKPANYIKRRNLSESDKQILADYDNAIRYNDFVINKIISLFEDSETIIVFVSDHGERVFDYDDEWGRNLTWNRGDLIQQFCIPMWIWCSKSYRKKHKDIVDKIKKAEGKRYMTDNLPQLMFHIAGIKCRYYNSKNDILSDTYNENRKRIIRHEKDFDKIIQE